jgi:NAD(P)-dependent dehydrogenase (short-subunit alcohol dehydrogenase family)
MGRQLVVTGPSEARVRETVAALARDGAQLVAGPRPHGDAWIAVCEAEGVAHMYRW